MKNFKECPKCREVKSVIYFDRNSKGYDGYYWYCKDCRKIIRKIYAKRPKIKVSQKICSNCQELKPIRKFYKNNGSRDGYTSRCKECFNKKIKEYRQTEKYDKFVNSDKQKKYRREYYREYYRKSTISGD